MDAHVFISHSHADKKIAQVLGQFIKEKTANRVGVYNSSSADFESTQVGKILSTDLRGVLAKTDVVILIYTREDRNWQYCMWECGLAINPRDERPTDVVVLQCGIAPPKVFSDTRYVDPRDLTSLIDFTKTLLTSDTFFRTLGRKVSEFNPEDPTLKQYGKELKDRLAKVIPARPEGQPSDVTSSTFLRIELPADVIERIEKANSSNRLDVTMNALCDHGSIVEHERAKELFNFEIDASTNFKRLLTQRQEDSSGAKAPWFKSLANQIAFGVCKQYPEEIPLAPHVSESGKSRIPYVARSRQTAANRMQFDTYFIPVVPTSVRVSERMIPISYVFHKTVPSKINLRNLIDEMTADGRTRLPILGEGRKALYIIHLSFIHKFISERALHGDSVLELTLDDLLSDNSYADFFRTTFVVVGPEATLAEAKDVMAKKKEFQDVFVTEDGTTEGAVIGWLTNTMML